MFMMEWNQITEAYVGRYVLHNVDRNNPWQFDHLTNIGKIVKDPMTDELCIESHNGVRTFLRPFQAIYVG